MAVSLAAMTYAQLAEYLATATEYATIAEALAQGGFQIIETGEVVSTALAVQGGSAAAVYGTGTALELAAQAQLTATGTGVATSGVGLGQTATGFAVLGKTSLTMSQVAAVVGPIAAGVVFGVNAYRDNPVLWTKLSQKLLPFCYPGTTKIPAWIDIARETRAFKVLVALGIIDAVKEFCEEEGIGPSEHPTATSSVTGITTNYYTAPAGTPGEPGRLGYISINSASDTVYFTLGDGRYPAVFSRRPFSIHYGFRDYSGSEVAYDLQQFYYVYIGVGRDWSGYMPGVASIEGAYTVLYGTRTTGGYPTGTAPWGGTTITEPETYPIPIIIVPEPVGPDYQPITVPTTPVTVPLPEPAPEPEPLPLPEPEPEPETYPVPYEPPEEWPEEEPWPVIIPFPWTDPDPDPEHEWPEIMPWPLPPVKPEKWPKTPPGDWPLPEDDPWPASPEEWPEEVPWPESPPDPEEWPETVPWPESPEEWPETVPWPTPWPEDWPEEVPWPIPWPEDLPYPEEFPTPDPPIDPEKQDDPTEITDPEEQIDPIIDPFPFPYPTPVQPTEPVDPEDDPTTESEPEPDPPYDPTPPTPDPPPPDGISPEPLPPIVPLPFSSTTGLISIYHPTQSELLAFANWLWVTWQDATIEKIWNNPFDGVITLFELYCTPTDVGRKNIRSGFLDSGVSSETISRYTEINCGTVGVPEYYGNYLDYAPYTKAYMYLPFIGVVELNSDDIVGHAVNVTYKIDEYNGACIAMITVAKVTEVNGEDVEYSNLFYQYSGNCAVELPIAGGTQAAIKAGMIQAAAYGLSSVIGGVISGATSGGLAGALSGLATGVAYGAAQAVGSVVSAKSSVQHSGSFGSSYGALGVKKPFITIVRPKQIQIPNYNELYGYQAHKAVTIGKCTGYLRCREVHVISGTASDEEKMLIEQLLKTGVYVTE